jgi:5-methylcytosine-specific restriction enzyme subunit McrC
LNFPEISDIKVTKNTFNKITYSRKTEAYRSAINIAKLLLLNYHPDIRGGSNSILAIMFDMNKLWEEFVYKSLRKHLGNEGYEVSKKESENFWEGDLETRKIKRGIEADIVIKKIKKTL